MRVTKLFKDFFDSEKAGGLVLIVCTILSLFIANSTFWDRLSPFLADTISRT
jgi:NhaA family Na+:H+ antiporter